MPGRKGKPTKLKLLEGNPGKKAINQHEPEPTPGIPAMPEWLSSFPVAVAEWQRESEILDAMGIMTVADASVLAIRCYLASEIQSMALDIEKEGRVVYQQKMDSLGNEIMEAKVNPKAVQIAKAIVEYRQHGTLLGFDPSSRSRLSVIDPNKKQSKFTGLINGGKK